jgi:hypothetical protein
MRRCVIIVLNDTFQSGIVRGDQGVNSNNDNNDNYTFPVRRLGVHLDHFKINLKGFTFAFWFRGDMICPNPQSHRLR